MTSQADPTVKTRAPPRFRAWKVTSTEPRYGSVYRITKYGDFTLLHTLTGSDGGVPAAPLVQGTDYYFYGTSRRVAGVVTAPSSASAHPVISRSS